MTMKNASFYKTNNQTVVKKHKDNMIATSILRRLERRYQNSSEAKASAYIHHLVEYIRQHPNILVILYVRVSTDAQAYNHNLELQIRYLRKELKKLNIPIIGSYREVSSGWILDPQERWNLVNAVQQAIAKKAVIVALSVNRFLRNINFNTKSNQEALPTEVEVEQFVQLTKGVPLLTLVHPDKTEKEVRGFISKLGQEIKGNKGGRPRQQIPGYKKRERLEKLPIVLELYNRKVKRCDIARRTGLKWDRVSSLIKN